MEKCELINMPLPHNLRGRETDIAKVRKLINTAIELGGNVYEIAGASGLLSAYHFLELCFDEQATPEKILSEDITLLTEAYVHDQKTGELERIFLYSDDATRDDRLVEEGSIQGGRLVIESDRLETIHEKGYSCIYQRAEDARQGITSDRYRDIFGSQQKRIPFELWDDSFCFVGNGFNQALLVRTTFESVLVMPDLCAVRESVKTFYAENLVREKYDPIFCIERIQVDAVVIRELESVRRALFGRGKMKEFKEFPDSYRKLTCQVAYIKIHYPDIYETVWQGAFEPDDETMPVFLDDIKTAALAVSFSGYNGSFAVCRMQDGSVKRVPDMSYPLDTPLCRKYEFKGYGDARNPGVAGSRMALCLKHILFSAEFMLDVEIAKVSVTHMGELPTSAEIVDAMEKRRKRAEEDGSTDTDVGLIAYHEVEDKALDGVGTIRWAAELAKLSQMEYVDQVTAMVTAYEAQDEQNRLEANELALIYDYNEAKLSITIVRKDEAGQLEVVTRQEFPGSERQAYDDGATDENTFPQGLNRVLEEALEKFMLNSGLRALGISGEKEADREAFAELRSSVPRVKRQFRRNDTAKIFFNNGYLSMKEDYPIEQFEEHYTPLLKKNEEILRGVLEDAGLCMIDLAKVYLAGNESEYPFVRKHLEEMTNARVCCINASECAAARGAVLQLDF